MAVGQSHCRGTQDSQLETTKGGVQSKGCRHQHPTKFAILFNYSKFSEKDEFDHPWSNHDVIGEEEEPSEDVSKGSIKSSKREKLHAISSDAEFLFYGESISKLRKLYSHLQASNWALDQPFSWMSPNFKDASERMEGDNWFKPPNTSDVFPIFVQQGSSSGAREGVGFFLEGQTFVTCLHVLCAQDANKKFFCVICGLHSETKEFAFLQKHCFIQRAFQDLVLRT